MRRTLPALALLTMLATTAACGLLNPTTDGDDDGGTGSTGDGDGGTIGDGDGDGDGDAGFVGLTYCDIDGAVLVATGCTVCHDGAQPPDLTSDAWVAAVSPTAGVAYVVAGDPAASFVYQKITNTQPSGTGGRMPPSGLITAEQQAMVEAWIADGATTDCEPITDAGTPPHVVPDVGSPPPGFSSTPPASAQGASCSTEQWWNFGNSESERMHPGGDCIQCHADLDEGPTFGGAGTVMGEYDDGTDCRGIPGVLVEIFDNQGNLAASTTTNSAGNFSFTPAAWLSAGELPYTARVTYDGRSAQMVTPQTDGACNSCHTEGGANGAPGRIRVP